MSNHAASTGGFVSAGVAGRVKWNVAPRPPSPLAQIWPPCDSTIDLQIARPMPLPCGFVVKNASNIWSALPMGSPGPVSFTEIPICHDHWKIVFQIGADRYAMLSGLTSHHPGHLADDLIDRDHLPFGRGLFVQRSQTVDDFRG